jgi:hypothetical protein
LEGKPIGPDPKKKKRKKKDRAYGFEELKCRLEFKVSNSFIFKKNHCFFKPHFVQIL